MVGGIKSHNITKIWLTYSGFFSKGVDIFMLQRHSFREKINLLNDFLFLLFVPFFWLLYPFLIFTDLLTSSESYYITLCIACAFVLRARNCCGYKFFNKFPLFYRRTSVSFIAFSIWIYLIYKFQYI